MTGMLQFLKQVATSKGSSNWKVQFSQHLFTGGVATAAHYIIMWVCLSASLSPPVATSIGFAFGAATKFLFSYFHIFEPKRNVPDAIPHFTLALLLQWVLNTALLTLFLKVSDQVWAGQVAVTILLTAFNFLVYKFWVFR